MRTVVRADLDDILADNAEKFEKLDTNTKIAVVGWGAAFISAFIFAEWCMHLPALDFLIGFPVQLIGLLVTPSLLYRYLKEGKDFSKDFGTELGKLTSELPGLKK